MLEKEEGEQSVIITTIIITIKNDVVCRLDHGSCGNDYSNASGVCGTGKSRQQRPGRSRNKNSEEGREPPVNACGSVGPYRYCSLSACVLSSLSAAILLVYYATVNPVVGHRQSEP